MPLVPKFKLDAVNGRVTYREPQRLADYIANLKDGEYEMVIQKPKKWRSNEQNRYFHGVIVKLIAEEIGLSPPEAKDMLKMMFLMHEKNGVVTLRSTADLSTVEQEEFNEHCRRWAAAEKGLNIPLPNEVDYSLFEDQYDTNDR